MVTRNDDPPHDQAAEDEAAFFEALEDKCNELGVAHPDTKLMDWVWERMGEAWQSGYQTAVNAIMTERDLRRS